MTAPLVDSAVKYFLILPVSKVIVCRFDCSIFSSENRTGHESCGVTANTLVCLFSKSEQLVPI